MYTGLKNTFKQIITSPQFSLTEKHNVPRIANGRSHQFILMDKHTDILKITQTIEPSYIEDENYDTGQITKVHIRDEYLYDIEVPMTGYKTKATNDPDCKELYKLCQARQEFEKCIMNKATINVLTKIQQK